MCTSIPSLCIAATVSSIALLLQGVLTQRQDRKLPVMENYQKLEKIGEGK